jgi:RNA-directed DNA polymerase
MTTRHYLTHTGKEAGRTARRKVSPSGFVRYADDFSSTAAPREELEAILPKIGVWLAERGRKLNEEKTRRRHKSEGFKFLGFQIRADGTKCLINPPKDQVQAKLKEIKEWLKKHPHVEAGTVVEVLTPLMRGWATYSTYGVSQETFQTIDHHLTHLLLTWARKKPLGKGVKWGVSRDCGRIGADHWVFKGSILASWGQGKESSLSRTAPTPITRHVKGKGTASPDDPTRQH